MELPESKDIYLRSALLGAISLCEDCTAVAEELRPIVEKKLGFIVPDDQKEAWTNRISHSLIGMRDRENWLLSPYYKPETKDNKSMNRKWIEDHRPGFDPKQRIWKITEKGMLVNHEYPSSDQQIPNKKSAPLGAPSKPIRPKFKKGEGKLTYGDAACLMYTYFKIHKSVLPMGIDTQREFIIDLLMKGRSADEAFSMALKNMV